MHGFELSMIANRQPHLRTVEILQRLQVMSQLALFMSCPRFRSWKNLELLRGFKAVRKLPKKNVARWKFALLSALRLRFFLFVLIVEFWKETMDLDKLLIEADFRAQELEKNLLEVRQHERQSGANEWVNKQLSDACGRIQIEVTLFSFFVHTWSVLICFPLLR